MYKFQTKENEDGTLTIIGSDEIIKVELVIPAEINGKIVTNIGSWAFSYNQITTVDFLNGDYEK